MNSEANVTPISNPPAEKLQQLVDERYQTMARINAMPADNLKLQHLRTAIAETSTEDASLTKEIQELMNNMEISRQAMAVDVRENLEKVTIVLRSEGLSETDETTLILAVDGSRVREKKEQRINHAMIVKYQELLRRHSVLEDKLNYLRKKVGSINNSITENEVEYKNEHSGYELLTSKLVEYNATVGTLETEIVSLKLEQLGPDATLDKFDKFMGRKTQLADIEVALTQYRDLPPNLLEAKALLENKQREYNEVNKEYENMS